MDRARAWFDTNVVQRVKYVFTQNVTPEKLALSLACGIAGGLVQPSHLRLALAPPLIIRCCSSPYRA